MRAGWAAWIIASAFVMSAHADTEPSAYQQAVQLFRDKAYLPAATKFEAAYQLSRDPELLFDIAQAYRLGHACAQAARYYHQFLDAVPHPPNRETLDTYIADMDACAKAEASAAPPPQVIHDTKVVHDTEVIHDADHRAPLVLAAVGVVGLGVGAYFSYDVHHIEQEYGALCTTACVWPSVASKAAELDTRGQHAEIGEATAYGVGAAALLVSAALLVFRGSVDHVTATPVPGGSVAGASWQF